MPTAHEGDLVSSGRIPIWKDLFGLRQYSAQRRSLVDDLEPPSREGLITRGLEFLCKHWAGKRYGSKQLKAAQLHGQEQAGI